MKLIVKNSRENPVTLLRRAGYAFQRREGEEASFVRVFGRSRLPRFHCYAKTEGSNVLINIHLDQKSETYGNSTRHHGEYENEGPLAEEVRRLVSVFGSETEIL